jgi:hypothetical protein
MLKIILKNFRVLLTYSDIFKKIQLISLKKHYCKSHRTMSSGIVINVMLNHINFEYSHYGLPALP